MFLNRLSVQNKILATLAVPFLVIFVAAAIFTWVSIDNWRDAKQVRQVTRFVGQAEELIDSIQKERDVALKVTVGNNEAIPAFEASLRSRDKSLDYIEKLYKENEFDAISVSAQNSLQDAIKNLRIELEQTEDHARRRASTPQGIAEEYSAIINRLFRFMSILGNTADDRTLGTATTAYADIYKYQDAIDAEAPLIYDIVVAAQKGTASPARERDAALYVRKTNDLRDETLDQLVRFDIAGASTLPDLSAKYAAVRQLVSNMGGTGVSESLLEAWDEMTNNEVKKLTPIRTWLRDAMESAATDAAAGARTQAVLTIGLMLLALVISLSVALLTSRSITTPLRNLARAADHVKNELPRLVEQVAVPGQEPDFELKPIEVESSDEVGQLAESFNSVNHTTIDIAREQAALRGSIAEMFINVARRDHVLLNRQLGFLDDLERAEEDPNTLANLFRLDHLATRMRRNSESLLVLAGIDSGRRVREPMAMSDVVRTASSEIEQYDRIQLNLQADPHMLGHAALNAAHLIAELLENATQFSEPHTPVEVTTATSKHFMTVTIRDYGLGMSDQDVEEANQKVASRSASDVVGVQRVGLFVVGRLADRLGVHVAFSRPSDGSEGTVVVLSFPYSLFNDMASMPLPEPTDPLSKETRAATENWIAPEPEVVKEVDLDALTDGTTSSGMPKRRVSTSTAPQGVIAPSAASAASAPIAPPAPAPAPAPVAPSILPPRAAENNATLPKRGSGQMTSPDFDEAAIVLPPLATPIAPVQADDSATWKPDVAPAPAPVGGLPTRRASAAPAGAVQDTAPEVVPQAPERRSAMFSNFRSFNPNDLPAVAPSQQLGGVAEAQNGQPQAPEVVEPLSQRNEQSNFEVISETSQSDVQAEAVSEPAPETRAVPATEDSRVATGNDIEREEQFEPIGHIQRDSLAQIEAPSALSAAEWEERFGELPTRASLARQARRSTHAHGNEEPETLSQESALHGTPEVQEPVAVQGAHGVAHEEVWAPTEAFEPLGQSQATPAAQVEPVYFPESAPQEEPETFVSEDTIVPGPEYFEDNGTVPSFSVPSIVEEPVEDVTLPRQPLQQPTPQPVAEQNLAAPVPTQQWGGQPAFSEQASGSYYPSAPTDSFAGAPGIVQEPQPSAQLNSAHPFTPFSAPSAHSPHEASVRPAPTPFGTAPTGYDVVADMPTPVEKAPAKKSGFLNKLFKKGTKHDQQQDSSNAPQGFSPEPRQAFGQPNAGASFNAPPSFEPVSGSYGATQASPNASFNGGYEPQPVVPQSFTPQANPAANAQRTAPAAYRDAGSAVNGYGALQGGSYQSAPAAGSSTSDAWQAEEPASGAGMQSGSYVPTFEAGAPLGAPSGESFAQPPAQSFWQPPTAFGQSALALQSTIQEQAFAELSELSAYRPNAVSAGGSSLKRRVRSDIAGPLDDPSAQKISRDAAELRSRLTAFQSATARGRQDGFSSVNTEQGAQGSEVPARVPDSVNQS